MVLYWFLYEIKKSTYFIFQNVRTNWFFVVPTGQHQVLSIVFRDATEKALHIYAFIDICVYMYIFVSVSISKHTHTLGFFPIPLCTRNNQYHSGKAEGNQGTQCRCWRRQFLRRRSGASPSGWSRFPRRRWDPLGAGRWSNPASCGTWLASGRRS